MVSLRCVITGFQVVEFNKSHLKEKVCQVYSITNQSNLQRKEKRLFLSPASCWFFWQSAAQKVKALEKITFGQDSRSSPGARIPGQGKVERLNECLITPSPLGVFKICGLVLILKSTMTTVGYRAGLLNTVSSFRVLSRKLTGIIFYSATDLISVSVPLLICKKGN